MTRTEKIIILCTLALLLGMSVSTWVIRDRINAIGRATLYVPPPPN